MCCVEASHEQQAKLTCDGAIGHKSLPTFCPNAQCGQLWRKESQDGCLARLRRYDLCLSKIKVSICVNDISIKTLHDSVFYILESSFWCHLVNWNSWRLLSEAILSLGVGCILDQFETWFSGHSIHLCTTQALCFWWRHFRWRIKPLIKLRTCETVETCWSIRCHCHCHQPWESQWDEVARTGSRNRTNTWNAMQNPLPNLLPGMLPACCNFHSQGTQTISLDAFMRRQKDKRVLLRFRSALFGTGDVWIFWPETAFGAWSWMQDLQIATYPMQGFNCHELTYSNWL